MVIKIDQIMNRLKEHYKVADEYGFEPIGIFLQGSQNYGLETPESDIDSKVIVLPKFDDFLLNKKPVSFTHIMENDEHVDFKDIRLYMKCFFKQNINFVEILFTDYFILNPGYQDLWMNLKERAEDIARYDIKAALNCIAGMAFEKQKALTHPYPSTMDKIEKYGYDAKQLHHILRLQEFIDRYIKGEKYSDCLKSKNIKYLIRVKKNLYSLEDAKVIADFTVTNIKKTKDKYLETHYQYPNDELKDFMNSVMASMVKRSFIRQLGG